MKHINKRNLTPPVEHGRRADRFATELPIDMGGIHGLTRNISATGVYFETKTAQDPGSRVRLHVEVNVRGEKLKRVCEGDVVRIDRNNGLLGIAAKFNVPFFSDSAEVINVATGSPAGRH